MFSEKKNKKTRKKCSCTDAISPPIFVVVFSYKLKGVGYEAESVE